MTMGTAAHAAASKKRPRFSVSQVRQYLHCPRAYYFARVLEIPEESANWKAMLGIAYHEVISSWHAAS